MTTAKNEVFISSIVKWGYQDNFSNLYFLRKDSERKKHEKAKQTTFTLLEVFVHVKTCRLCGFLFVCFCFVSWFWFDFRFCMFKNFW